MKHSVDGMPHCKHCDRKFQRFEGFKKHVEGACPVLFPPVACHTSEGGAMGSAADVGVQVAPRRETPLGRVSHAGPQPESVVLIDDPSFRALLRKQWKSVLHNSAYRLKNWALTVSSVVSGLKPAA